MKQGIKLAHEHMVRPRGEFERLEWKPDGLGPGLHIIIGTAKSGAEQVQALQFGADHFTKESALVWLKEHGL